MVSRSDEKHAAEIHGRSQKGTAKYGGMRNARVRRWEEKEGRKEKGKGKGKETQRENERREDAQESRRWDG